MTDLARVELKKRRAGEKIMVETENSVYEIDIIGPNGKCIISGSNEFLEPTEILLIGCTGYKGWLVFGEGLEFAYNNENGDLSHGHTSPLISCCISGVDASDRPWKYEVWEGQKYEDTSTTK